MARRPATHGRPEGRLGQDLAARSNRGCGPRAHRRPGGDKVLALSTAAKRQMRRARGAEAGLTENVERRWGGRKWLTRWRSGGGRLRWGGGVLGDGPAARGKARGKTVGTASERRRNHSAGGGGEIRLTAARFPFKGGGGNAATEGRGSRATCGAEWGRARGGGRGVGQRSGVAQARCGACGSA
jgi:hypothetical protein